ncbi:MAG: phosphoglycerate kinase, partial [bacterium]|nr:phosphoglycerate kinase [bacterium]
GAKVSDKIDVIKKLLPKVNHILLGGGPANTFLKASGVNIGGSLFEASELEIAKELLKSHKIVIPQDSSKTGNTILDIGPKTIKCYSDIIKFAETIVWGGPMGLFEKKKFSIGTKAIWQAIIRNKKATVVVGGGETIASLKLITADFKLKNKNIFLSTGGGAMLEFLAGKKLPALVALKLQRR